MDWYLIIWWGGVRLTFRFHDCMPECLDESPAPSRRSVPNKPLVLSTWSMWTFNNSVYLSWTFVNSFLISFSFSSRRNTVVKTTWIVLRVQHVFKLIWIIPWSVAFLDLSSNILTIDSRLSTLACKPLFSSSVTSSNSRSFCTKRVFSL